MLTLPSNVKLYLAVSAIDFRKSFDGLAAIVTNEFGMNILSGNVFIFLNKRANQVRLLFWERDGLCIIAKRLEAGTFRKTPSKDINTPQIEIEAAQLVMLLEGIEVSSIRRRKRYVLAAQHHNN